MADTLYRLWDARDLIVQVAGSIVIIASLIVAGTRTPDPATPLGKVYRVIERLALIIGRAKETGGK